MTDARPNRVALLRTVALFFSNRIRNEEEKLDDLD